MTREPMIVSREPGIVAARPLRAGGILRRPVTDHRPGPDLPSAPRSFVESRFGRDFSRVQAHASSVEGPEGFFVNGPGPGSTPAPSSPPPARAAANCPADIRVASVEPGNDRDFGRDGPITGWGGFAVMEVSDPSGKNWDGTAIHENLRNVKNTCGSQGTNACSNRSGEAGGTGGSSFKVGQASNFLELASLPAARNRFYDLHVFVTKGSSLLHVLNRPSCEIQCEQFYDCGGRRFGPDFTITYTMTRGSVPRSAGGFHAVTRVHVSKAVKAAPAAAPSGSAAP